jgi:hypothetical protein
MRIFTLFLTMFGLVTGLHAQTTAPIEVVNSAIAAVNDLGKQVVLGKMKTSMERMYPQWRQRLSERAGGDAALEKTFDEMMAEMMKQGTTMISFKTFGFPTVYDVYPGKKVEIIDGKSVETLINTKWMLLIPTEIRYRVMNGATPLIIESKGYQIAISDKDKVNWTFIDGSGLKVQDLRSMFISLPKDMILPEIKRREVPRDELNK